MKYTILERDIGFFDKLSNVKIIKDISQTSNNDIVIMGGDVLRSDVRQRINDQSPTIFIARGYLGNHLYKSRKWWRYSINGFSNIKLLSVPHPRWHLLNLPRHPWKVKEVKRILIAPSKMTSKVWTPAIGGGWVEDLMTKFPGAEIKIRDKLGKAGLRWSTLWADLDWADLVVSQASAITAEAFWYGKKVISLCPCSTWATGEQLLENWKDPTEPELRDAWHEHLAWSQFTDQEWMSGTAFNLINSYIPSIEKYDPGYRYNFVV